MTLPRVAARPSQANFAGDPLLPAEVVREALARLVADSAFKASERNRRFLAFVVEEALAGRSGRIKSYTIAVDVFGRGERFDPATDPIVRIEATRLRAALSAYYTGPGRHQPVRISIPKGGYVPAVEPVPGAEATQSPTLVPMDAAVAGRDAPLGEARARTWFASPVLGALAAIGLAALVAVILSKGPYFNPASAAGGIVIVEDTVAMGGGGAEAATARGLTQSLVMFLSQMGGVTVIAGGSPETRASRNEVAAEGAAVFVLSSSIRFDGQQLHAWWSLAKADSGEIVWSDVSDRQIDGASVVGVEAEIASGIADRIGASSAIALSAP